MSRLLTVVEAAEYLRVTPYTVRKWLRRGKIRGSKIGRIYRILESELQAALFQGNDEEPFQAPGGQSGASDLFGKYPRPGRSLDDFVREKHEETLREERLRRFRHWHSLSREERQRRVNALMGKYTDIPVSSEDLIRERREEAERDEKWFKEHFGQ